MQYRGGINLTTGKQTTMHSPVVKIKNAKNNPQNNLKKQLKVAEENHLELMRMFSNGDIKEKPIKKTEAAELVNVFLNTKAIFTQTNTSIYTGYTGVGLSDEPYRYFI